MGSTKEKPRRVPAAERVLRAASELFYREGIRAVGVEAVAAEAGVTKKTLYDNYGSKDQLIAAYLKERDRQWREWVLEVAERTGGTPESRMLSSFDALGEWMEKRNPRGCGFVNAAVELPDGDHPGRAVIWEQKRWIRGHLAGLAKEAGLQGTDKIAERLMILHEGAAVVDSLGLARDAAGDAKRMAEGVLDQARGS